MSAINEDTRAAWQALADKASAQRPSVGKRVRVTVGKHSGRTGVVIRHQRSRYTDAWRYASEASAHLRDLQGRYGFVVRIRFDDALEAWVNADHVEVIGG